jgi:ABC-type branched-subunit amino acid transport system ATPase component/branched-subunit amino acid ABC-type transport system permease component
LLPFIIAGIVTGSVYGLAGVGLVLTYKTSGIFNFAQGALATVAAYLFYFLNTDHGVAWPIAALISVVVLGAAMGIGFESIAKDIARTSLAWRIVATIGIVLIVEAAFTIIYGSATLTQAHFLPQSTVRIFGTNVTWEQIIITVISLGSAGALYAFFRFARMGKAMRAVVDDPDLLGLAGTSPNAVRRWAWVIGCVFAAASGVLLAPSVPLDPNVLTLLIVQAFGAAAIGRFASLPLTLAGGLAIGIGASIATEYINTTSLWNGLPPSLPFIVLFVVILLSPRARLVIRQSGLRQAQIPWRAPGSVQLAGTVVVVAFLVTVPAWVGFRLSGWTTALIYVILLLSLGLLARTSGQVSLCHVSFAAIGAVAFSKLSVGAGLPWIPALIVAGLVVVPIGALLAIPAIRLSGLYLALATFGFGILVQDMFYSSNLMFGSSLGISMPTPHLSWLDVSGGTGFYYVVLVIAALVAVAVVVLVRSRLGRLLRSMSDSPVGLSTSGTSVHVTMVIVFCISAFLAGIAGALLGMLFSTASGSDYPPLLSLSLIALIMISVGGAPWYALIGAAGIGLIPVYVTSANTSNYLEIIFGAAAVAGAIGLQARMPAALGSLVDRFGAILIPATLARRFARYPSRAAAVPDGQVTLPSRPATHPEHPGGAEAAAARRDEALAARRDEAVAAPGPGRAQPVALEVEGLRVRFGGLVAVAGLDLVAPPGRITGLIGPNGAGKTTVFNACSGLVSPGAGKISLSGRNVTSLSAARRARSGLGRTFQQMELFDSLSVLDNVVLGFEASRAGGDAYAQVIAKRGDRRAGLALARSMIDLCGLAGLEHAQAGSLSTGQRRLVELARCLAGPFGVLLLDEPSSGLDHAETEAFGRILRQVVDERGIGILLVEHDMALVMDICDDIFVLDFGTLIFRGTPEDVQGSPIVRAAYLGTAAPGAQFPGAEFPAPAS